MKNSSTKPSCTRRRQAGMAYAEQRGAVIFEPTDSASQRRCTSTGCWYTTRRSSRCRKSRSPKDIRHRLATWYAHQLPKDDPLLG